MAQPNPSSNKSHHGPSFTVGVALGAMVGAGALAMMSGKKLDKTTAKLKKKLDAKLDDLKQNHPEAAKQIDDVVKEAKQAIKTTTKAAKKAVTQAKQAPSSDAAKPKAPKKSKKKTFTRSGKPLSS